MKALVVYGAKSAGEALAVSDGLRDAGVEFDLKPAESSPGTDYDLVLVGSQAVFFPEGSVGSLVRNANWVSKRVGLFFSTGILGRKVLVETERKIISRGGAVVGSVGLRRSGFLGLGKVSEVELARARAFGERMGLNLRGIRARKSQEKAHIRFYKKTHEKVF